MLFNLEKNDMQLKVKVSGRVQGVGFRYNTRNYAQRLGLVGWVKNTPGGKVEVCAQGPKEALDDLLQWLHQGPSYSWVEGLEHTWIEKNEKFSSFKIKF
jgi:acylphosphatase